MPTEVVRTPLTACELAEPLPLALDQYREVGATLEPAAPDDRLLCEPGEPSPRPSAALFRLTPEVTLRLWLSGGPYPDLSGLFPPTFLRVYRGCPGEAGSTVVACGDALATDLPPGRYFITAVHRSPRVAVALNLAGGAFAYRVSALGDTRCPEELATRRLDEWMGESPPVVRDLGDLNHDSRNDLAVEYRNASSLFATRVLVADDYPRCLRTVFDESAQVKVEGGESGGFKRLRASSVSPPEDGRAERATAATTASYDRTLGRYVMRPLAGRPPGASRARSRAPAPP